MNARIAIAILAGGLTACTQRHVDHTIALMQQCVDDLDYGPRPFSCDDALTEYRKLDMERVDVHDRIAMRLIGAQIAEKQRP